MTSRQLYEGVLIELNKENAPNILLEDFNYFANKAINNYVNKRYNIYDVNQQTTDDLRVLKATALLKPTRVNEYAGMTMARSGNMATYEVVMPSDYLHILNCICIYKVNKTYKCYNLGDTWRAAATRLTADAYSQVLDNFWLKPTYKRPYYYIHNVNSSRDDWKSPSDTNNGEARNKINYATIPTNPYDSSNGSGTDISSVEQSHTNLYGTNNYGTDGMGQGHNIVLGKGLPDTITVDINGTPTSASNRERGQGLRYGNVSLVRLEIRYGTDNSVFELTDVYVDYIKAPLNIRLTQEEIDTTEDISQMLEYPDYVCQEIINELVHLVMENISDLRLQTHPVVSLSIANPAQALAPAASGQTAQ